MSTENTARQPKGVPAGGQFAATTHSDAVEPLLRPVILDLAFDHGNSPFQAERDGEGRYTIYTVDEECAEIASFAFAGDSTDEAALEAAAVEALTAQQARLAVSSPGARALWTDPDGGVVQSGNVVSAKGEIITVALDSDGDAEVFGNELAAETTSPATVDLNPYPHSDARYPHPMNSWPEEVEAPASIVLGDEESTVDEVPCHTLYPDPQNARTISEPRCTITMTNGATLKVAYVGDPEGGNSEETFTGDWDAYLKGDTYARDQVIETAHETMLQARK
jgi:hypothetical protein